MQENISIKINVSGDHKNVQILNGEFGNLEKNTESATKAIEKLTSRLRSMGHTGTLAIGLGAIFKGVSSRIINTNSSLEVLRNSLTTLNAALAGNTSSTGRVLSTQDKYRLALSETKDTMSELLKLNAQTPHSLEQTATIYKTMLPSMKAVGASSQDLIEITKRLSIATASLDFNSVIAGVDGLASGMVLANSDLGRFLKSTRLSNEELKNTSDVVGLIKERLSGFEALDSFDIRVSNLKNTFNNLSAELGAGAFDALKDGVSALDEALKKINPEKVKELVLILVKVGASALAAHVALRTASSVNFRALNASLSLAQARTAGLSLASRSLSSAMRAIPFVAISAGLFSLIEILGRAKEKNDILNESFERSDLIARKLTAAQIEYRKSVLNDEIRAKREEIARLAIKTRAAHLSGLGILGSSAKERLEARNAIDTLKQEIKALKQKRAALDELASAGRAKETLKTKIDTSAIDKEIKKVLNPLGAKLDEINLKWQRHIATLRAAGTSTQLALKARDTERALAFADFNKKDADEHKKLLEQKLRQEVAYYTRAGDLAAAWQAKKELLELKGETGNELGAFKDLQRQVNQNMTVKFELVGVDEATSGIANMLNSAANLKLAALEYSQLQSAGVASSHELARARTAYSRQFISSLGAMNSGLASLYAGDEAKQKKLHELRKVIFAAEMAMKLQDLLTTTTNETAKSGMYASNALLSSLQAPPPANFASFAAVSAIVASLLVGFGGGATDSISASDDLTSQKANDGKGGAGYADPNSANESIKNSLKMIEAQSEPQTLYLRAMLQSISKIESSLSGGAKGLSRQQHLINPNFSTLHEKSFGDKLKSNLSFKDFALSPLTGLFKLGGNILGGISNTLFGGSSSTKLTDAGLVFGANSLNNAKNLNLSEYQSFHKHTSGGWFRRAKDEYWASTNAVNNETHRIFSGLLGSVKDSLSEAGKILNVDVSAALSKSLDLGKISLKDKSAQQIKDLLSSVIGKAADQATSALKGSLDLDGFAQVGEGYYETFLRLARAGAEASYYTDLLGVSLVNLNNVSNKSAADLSREFLLESLKQNLNENLKGILSGVKGDINELASAYKTLNHATFSMQALKKSGKDLDGALINYSGGLNNFGKQLDNFSEKYLSAPEQLEIQKSELKKAFGDLGLDLPRTKEHFKQLVQSAKLESKQDKIRLARLLELSNAYEKLANLEKKAADEAKKQLLLKIKSLKACLVSA